MKQIRAHVLISGKVQGVYFRRGTRREAMIEGVKGWVKNLDDNRVEAVFEGEETAVDALVVFCREGPKAAQITDVVVEWGPYTGEFDTFSIVY